MRLWRDGSSGVDCQRPLGQHRFDGTTKFVLRHAMAVCGCVMMVGESSVFSCLQAQWTQQLDRVSLGGSGRHVRVGVRKERLGAVEVPVPYQSSGGCEQALHSTLWRRSQLPGLARHVATARNRHRGAPAEDVAEDKPSNLTSSLAGARVAAEAVGGARRTNDTTPRDPLCQTLQNPGNPRLYPLRHHPTRQVDRPHGADLRV